MSRPYQSDTAGTYRSGLVDIAGIVIERREKSVWLNDGTKKVWLPLSQVELDPVDAGAGNAVSVAMPEWLAKEKGLI